MDYKSTDDLGEARHKLRAAARFANKYGAMRDYWQNEVRSMKAQHNLQRKADIVVSDHAVLRYLERVKGMDVEEIREMLAQTVRSGTPAGFELIDCGEFRAVYKEEDLNILTIVTPPYRDDAP